jgi:uncharacterized membrane protein YkoI
MKNLFLAICLLTITVGFIACEDDDQLVDLPQSIEAYITSNYPGYEVDESEEEVLCSGTNVYEIEIENEDTDEEVELTFDTEGNFLFSETEIETTDLPSSVVSSINGNYAGYEIEEVEALNLANGTQQYEIELEKGDTELEVLFEADGTVVCEGEEDE